MRGGPNTATTGLPAKEVSWDRIAQRIHSLPVALQESVTAWVSQKMKLRL